MSSPTSSSTTTTTAKNAVVVRNCLVIYLIVTSLLICCSSALPMSASSSSRLRRDSNQWPHRQSSSSQHNHQQQPSHSQPPAVGQQNSRAEFDSALKEAITEMRSVLATRTQKFDEFFRELLKSSKRDFHQMFLQTYGLLYERHSSIFTDMFHDLERYYMNGAVDLTEAMDTFFHRLYQKMFQVLNAQYKFDDKYLNCISEHMEELKPFGDVPKKLTVEIKRSFIATRTFVQAMSNGKDVVKNIMEVPASSDCTRQLLKMTNCPHCHDMPEIKPCANYCMEVMRGCLAYHQELDKEWNNYIDTLVLLATRLETSFNIESVVDPIDIKISEAIMNFQENGPAVSQRLFDACGKPRVMAKREAPEPVAFDPKFGNVGAGAGQQQPQQPSSHHNSNQHHNQQPPFQVSPTTSSGTSMERLIQDIKKKIKRTKFFWSRLPQQLCGLQQAVAVESSPTSTSPSPDGIKETCWNGSGRAHYEMDTITGDGTNSNNNHNNNNRKNSNQELNLAETRHSAIINQQILTLKMIVSKLNYAYNGIDVDWGVDNNPDPTEDGIESSGSGSGSGGGEDPEGPFFPPHPNPSSTEDPFFFPTKGPWPSEVPNSIDPTDGHSKGGKPSPDSATRDSVRWPLILALIVCSLLAGRFDRLRL